MAQSVSARRSRRLLPCAATALPLSLYCRGTLLARLDEVEGHIIRVKLWCPVKDTAAHHREG
jgi:hypothetical protein